MTENFWSIKKMIDYSTGGITSKVITKTENTNITLFCMAKSTDISEHTSTKKGFVYILEGKGVFTLEGDDIPMLSGTLISMGKNAIHSIKAEENTSFLLFLF